MTNNKDKRPTLVKRVGRIDQVQAARLQKLRGASLEAAAQGIVRHLRACARMDVAPDASAVREIIDDSKKGRRIFEVTNDDTKKAV